MNTGQKLFTKLVIWFAGEVLLTLIGLDTVADYGEFLLEHTASQQLQSTADTLELINNDVRSFTILERIPKQHFA